MGIETVVESLNGAQLQKLVTTWQGFFVGNVAIEDLQEDDQVVRFVVVIPTADNDIGDFFGSRETLEDTTRKAVLEQSGQELPRSRVVGIDRVGPDPRWTPGPAHQYRISFEVDASALRMSEPLDLRLRWPVDPPQTDVAIARGR